MTQTPPHSIEAEQSVLGGILIDPGTYDDVADIIGAKDFYHPAHSSVYTAISKLAQQGKPVDVVTVSETIGEEALELMGGWGFVADLPASTPTSKNVVAYAEVVRDKAILRGLHEAGREIMDLATGKGSPQELIDKAEGLVYGLSERSDSDSQPGEMLGLLRGVLARIDHLQNSGGGLTGITTGFVDLDSYTSGWQPGDLIIVAGRPSMGKTAFMMNTAEAALLDKAGPVIVFSVEMPEEQLMMRFLSGLSRVELAKIRTGTMSEDEFDRVCAATTGLHNLPLFLDDDSDITPLVMRARARRIAKKHGNPSLILVDYLQLMCASQDNRVAEVTAISRQMKAMAKEFGCAVIAGSQLNRGLEQRPNKRPLMSDLRESGAIEQDADVIIGLYRDEVYAPREDNRGVAEAIILKQRQGGLGTVDLTWLGQYTRFENAQKVRYGAMEDSF